MWLETAILTLQLHNTGTPCNNVQFHTRHTPGAGAPGSTKGFANSEVQVSIHKRTKVFTLEILIKFCFIFIQSGSHCISADKGFSKIIHILYVFLPADERCFVAPLTSLPPRTSTHRDFPVPSKAQRGDREMQFSSYIRTEINIIPSNCSHNYTFHFDKHRPSSHFLL